MLWSVIRETESRLIVAMFPIVDDAYQFQDFLISEGCYKKKDIELVEETFE